MIYQANAVYSFIPKNACSTMRLSVAHANGCIDSIEQGHWIHANNGTFNATLGEAIKADYTFTILRCPFRRLASVFLDKFVAKEPLAWSYRTRLERKIELDSLTFRDFVKSLTKAGMLRSDIHWRPQVDFLLYSQYHDYFCLENFEEIVRVLKDKIDFKVIDARSLTNHGLSELKAINTDCFADSEAFDIAIMKRNGECPDYNSMYDDELYLTVSNLYREDIQLYKDKFSDSDILKIVR